MKRLRRIYLEISNICNLQCTFCPAVERPKKTLCLADFSRLLTQALPLADEICLHLMGEPLSHPQFREILDECDRQGAQVNLTTNGTLLARYGAETFFRPSIRQINFSLHSFTDNYPGQDPTAYLYDILQFTKQALQDRPELYINFRLWNLPGPTAARDENQPYIDAICGFFNVPINERVDVAHRKSKNVTGRAYFHFDTRFEWPGLGLPVLAEKGFCHALSQHVGVHADGTVVACCLDKEAGNNLGNALETPLSEILDADAARKLREGFQRGELLSPLCQRCDYISRFKKLPRSLGKNTAPTQNA
jgi:radical SAM protein with 4Fe4S-binding SPASM domain